MTTNNRMEIRGVLAGLLKLKEPCNVNVYSDSRYVVDAIGKGWVYAWKSKGWMKSKTEKAKNDDLWRAVLEQLDRHNVELHWVKGHAGHPENERCDRLAVAAAAGDNLKEDEII